MPGLFLRLAPVLVAVSAQTAPSIEANGVNVMITASGSTVIASQDLIVQQGGQTTNVMESMSAMSTLMGQLSTANSQMSAAMSAMSTNVAAQSTRVASQSTAVAQQLVDIDARARAADDSSAIDDLQGQIDTAAAAAAAADHSEVIATLTATVNTQINATTNGFADLRARVTVLEDHVWNTTANTSIFRNGDFEDADGQAAHVPGYELRYPSSESAISLISLDADNRPPTVHFGKTLNHALRIGTGTNNPCTDLSDEGCYVEYLLVSDSQIWPKMCRGRYQFSAWARRSADWSGFDMLFHHRWWPYGGGSAHQQWAAAAGTGSETGSFPSGTEWERIEVTVMNGRDSRSLQLYLGYPWLSTSGHVDITGLDVRRIGGPGNC